MASHSAHQVLMCAGTLGGAALLELLLGGTTGGALMAGALGGVGGNFLHQLTDRLAGRLSTPGGISPDFLRNEDLERLVGTALAAALGELAQDEALPASARARLPVIALKAREGWLAIAGHPSLADLNATGLTRLFAMRSENYATARSLDPTTWSDFLEFLDSAVADDGIKDRIATILQSPVGSLASKPLSTEDRSIVGQRLAARMPTAIQLAAKKAFQANDPAFAALHLRLMQALMSDVRDVLATVSNTADTVDAIARDQQDIKRMLMAIADASQHRAHEVLNAAPADCRPVLAPLVDRIDGHHAAVLGAIQDVVARVDRLQADTDRIIQILTERLPQTGPATPGPPARPSVGVFQWLVRGRRPADIRSQVLERMQRCWIDGVLQHALSTGAAFELGIQVEPTAVLRQVNYEDVVLPPTADMPRIFRAIGPELLILGVPGGGKTIALLRLARELIAAAKTDHTQAVPLVLNLSSWARSRKPLREWMIAEASATLLVPKKLIARLVDDEAVLPLLDGLDEVPEDAREACVSAINDFKRQHPSVGTVVCSRARDYAALQAKLDLRAAVLIQPLDEQQVRHALNRPDLGSLRRAMAEEPWLKGMATTPFLLNVMCFACAGMDDVQMRLPDGRNGEANRLEFLLDRYVHRRLAESRGVRAFSATQLRGFLAWLAGVMARRGDTVFCIEHLQAETSRSFIAHVLYSLFAPLAFLVAGLGVLFLGTYLIAIGIETAFPEQVRSVSPSGYVNPTASVIIKILLVSAAGAYCYVGGCLAAAAWARDPGVGFVRQAARFSGVFAAATLFQLCVAAGLARNELSPTLEGLGVLILLALFSAWVVLIQFGVAWVLQRLQSPSISTHAVIAAALSLLPGFLLMAHPPRQYPNPVYWGLMLGLCITCVCIVAAVASRVGYVIVPADKVLWKWSLFGSLAGAAFMGAIIVFLYLASANDSTIPKNWSWVDVAAGTAAFIVIGGGLFGIRRSEHSTARFTPNEGIHRSLWQGIRMMGIVGLGFGILLTCIGYFVEAGTDQQTLARRTSMCMAWLVFAGGVGAMLGGLDVPVKHYFVRLLLRTFDRVPLGMANYLLSGVDHMLLRRVGGGFMFTHRYVLEYFASRPPARRK